MMDRVVGKYVLGQRIGSGSFAVVWRAKHKESGEVVAVKEIDKKILMSGANKKLGENLMKEIQILERIRHPNIIRLFEAIETEDKIFLVLEYCNGGDLGGYLHRCGKVSEGLARHLMQQLASGLQVLNENRLIHRDLKPQNLLLSNSESIPLLKIGDFGFARYLAPQGLADTLCGSPLYMAPEIILNKKYDGKADLWSAGAILFQLVTGKPPFDGDSQLQLFQNVLTSSHLQFPRGALEELHPDCINLCRSLLRLNPVERLSFEEFFNHKFLEKPGSSKLSDMSGKYVHGKDAEALSGNDAEAVGVKDAGISCSKEANSYMESTVSHGCRASIEVDRNLVDQLKVADLLDSIEKDYVLVSAHFASTGSFSCSLDTSQLLPAMQSKEMCSVYCSKDLHSSESAPLTSSSPSTILTEVQRLAILHPSTRLELLHQYIGSLTEVAQTKFVAGLYLESFAVELVVLALWNESIRVCLSWLSSTKEGDPSGSSSSNNFTSAKEGSSLCCDLENVDFSIPQSVSKWSEQGFVTACSRAEKLSDYIQQMEGNCQMPDAMEVIFQTALECGKSGGVDELMGNKVRATASYLKAKILLLFILEEAMSLPLNPPFSLTLADRERIKGYILKFESRQSHSHT